MIHLNSPAFTWPFIASIALSGPAIGSEARVDNLISGCSGCHGYAGEGYRSLPAIRGRSADATLAMLLEFKSGQRQSTVMRRIAQGYSDEELRAMADYLASIR